MREDLPITVHNWTPEEQQAVDDFWATLRNAWDNVIPWYELEDPESEAGAQRYRDYMKFGGNGFPPSKRLDDIAVNIPIPSSTGNDELFLRIFRPPGPSKGVFLHFHSGGWVVGSVEGDDENLYRLARNTEYTVASVEYRLAPKHIYPKAIDDGVDAALFFLQPENQAKYGQLRVIGGESAGAHLSMAVMFRLRKNGINLRDQFDCLVFNYGVFDVGLTPSVQNNSDTLVLSKRDMVMFAKAWIGDLDPKNADISPLYESDFTNLPPAMFLAGDKDELYDDSLFAAIKWHTGKNKTDLFIFPGSYHGLSRMGGPDMEASLSAMEAFVHRHNSEKSSL